MSNSGVRAPSRPSNDIEPARRGHSAALADLLPQVNGAAFRRFGFVQSSVVSRWPEIVGARFAEASAPESIRFPRGSRQDGTLHLIVRPAHGVMMQHVTPEIIERVNRFFGYPAIARIVFRQGDLPTPAATPRAAPPSLKPVPAEFSDSLRQVADPELRAVLEALAAGVSTTKGPPAIGAGDAE